MRNIMLTGIGGQGTVLAAKILAQAYQSKGCHVRTAETIGMAQRGGNVVSHVRVADPGCTVFSPLMPQASADAIIAFEPAEALRVLPFLRAGGQLITATSAVQPVTAALSPDPYTQAKALELLAKAVPDAIVVDDAALMAQVGNPKALNVVLLAIAQSTGMLDITVDELKAAVAACVKPRFVEMNCNAIDLALAR